MVSHSSESFLQKLNSISLRIPRHVYKILFKRNSKMCTAPLIGFKIQLVKNQKCLFENENFENANMGIGYSLNRLETEV